MASGGNIACKRKTGNKVRSDESDEDYMVSEDEFDELEDESCSSLADDETEESLGELEEEEEEEEEMEERVKSKIKKVGIRRGRNGFQGRKNNGVVKPRKKKADYGEEGEDYSKDDFAGTKRKKKSKLARSKKEDDDIGVLNRQEEDDFGDKKPRKRTHVSTNNKYVGGCNPGPRKKAKVSYREEKKDNDYDDSDSDDDDEEFTPDEFDGVEDDEELPVMKKRNVGRLRVQGTQIANGKKRKRNVEALKRTNRKKPKKEQVSRIPNRYLGKELRDENRVVSTKKKVAGKGRGRRKSTVNSDSNFMSSGSSDYEYTISEEEREQVREASDFCGRLATSIRSSSSLKLIEEEDTVPSQRKCQGRKGKEKTVDVKIEVGKQVCGICLSEEGKRTVRGILNCCSHYFCFACIMEWSKVESRCPLCKQRFATITRTSRADGGHDSRHAVIPVPERDQVYQPSEEELRGFLDPYENVLCTECHEGRDDELMLLCDLCDSPAHTYCVGLGCEVPEGNWYCDSCRPTVLASSIPDHGANSNLSIGSSPIGAVRETFDLNELYVPETPLNQATGHSPSPRSSIGDVQATSPASGSGAFTLFARRRIQRQIHQLLNNRTRQLDRSNSMAPVSGISLFGAQIWRDGLVAPHHAVPVWAAPENICHQGRLADYTAPSLYGREALSQGLTGLRGQIFHHQASTSTDRSCGELSHIGFSGTNSRIGQGLTQHQLRPCNSMSNTGMDASRSLYPFREEKLSSLEKEQVQSIVRSHLKSLSRNSDLGYVTFKHIARTSTHTILAAFGLEHRWNEVHPVRTRPLICYHFDRSSSRQMHPIAGQCSSCFDWFVRNVVMEIMSTRVPLLSSE
ncbi:Lysine-specific demethylase rbr-2 [Sesamum alatum]|uniref:Lysine-specific demethylase rbr-2 n=1 Tax=Sesamum alatum TaxID=300844 RepID=A0AAE1Y6E6_9LAMI|nr:Lysine-specific demethylase rbr-2 [Sesamum alatum]